MTKCRRPLSTSIIVKQKVKTIFVRYLFINLYQICTEHAKLYSIIIWKLITNYFRETRSALEAEEKIKQWNEFVTPWLRSMFDFTHKGIESLPQNQFSNPYIFGTWWCKPLIFQTLIIWYNIIHCLKYLRSTILGCKDIWIRNSEFVARLNSFIANI